MLDKTNYTYEDDIKFDNFEFSPIYSWSAEWQRQPPFKPPFEGNFPPGFNKKPNQPEFEDNTLPNFNYPGGTFNPPGMPKSPPPTYTPKMNDSGVQKFNASPSTSYGPKAVSPQSIRFCLYKYTYIWEVNGRSYWTFLLNIDRRTASGFRWFRNTWVYWGIDLRRIDSFICYRSTDSEYDCVNCTNTYTDSNSNLYFRSNEHSDMEQDLIDQLDTNTSLGNGTNLDSNAHSNTGFDFDSNRNDNALLNVKKQYSLDGTKEVYSCILASIDIPQIKKDVITETLGIGASTKLRSDLPCVKARNIGYRITLEVTYPSDYDESLKSNINKLAAKASYDAYKVISASRSTANSSNPLELYNSSLEIIPEALKAFSDSFNTKLSSFDLSLQDHKDITYSIRSEKIHTNWKPYFYNDSLY